MSCNKTAYTGEVIQMCRALCEYIKIKPLHRYTGFQECKCSLNLQSIIQLGKVNIGKKGGMTREISISTEDLDGKRGIYEDYDLEILKDYDPIVHAQWS